MADNRLSAIEQDKNDIRIQIGRDPAITPFLVLEYDANVILEEGTAKIFTQNLDDSWIVGSVSNGIVGDNTGTEGGGQQVVGATSRVFTVKEILNPNNVFYENFRDDVYKGAGTADWDSVTDFQLEMTNGETQLSEVIALQTGVTYNNATMFVTIASGDLADLTLKLSANSGSNKETVTHGTLHTFTDKDTTGIIWEISSSGTVTISKIKIVYS